MSRHLPTLHDVYRAHVRIAPMVVQTPLLASADLAEKTGARNVFLKLECLQATGSFKVRGAANKILSLNDAEKKNGVITFSTGNHGRAVAHVAGKTGIHAVVCLSEHVAPYRAEAIRKLGAEVAIKGKSQDEAEENYCRLTAARGHIPVVPFDDPMIIAGQGTIALEILSRLPNADVLLIPLSGGGLLAGMALAAKTINPGIHIVGISIARSPAMLESLKAGRPVEVEENDSVADSLLGGIGHVNRYTLQLVKNHTDEHLVISEAEIKSGMCHIFENHRLIVEGAAAVGVGALVNQRIDVKGKTVVALLSGNSINSNEYISIIRSGRGDAEKQ
ncbi:pyridoxal-phosphate dependent enzyme [Desulfosarcina sp.]|uniref:pyridoxal-phosphate dependent enzyme n=1 Tax=Desulfosarcina sp. TaxID=2027861 RepID=UPI0039705F1D